MKKIFETLKEIKSTPRGKALLFFIFYVVFFICLFAIINSNKSTKTEKNYDDPKGYDFNFTAILDNNYHFKYIVLEDDKKQVYEGNKKGDKELFTLNNQTYYREKDEYYIRNNSWNKVNSPNKYSNFINIKNIEKIIKKSYFEYKTNYQSGQNKYNFLVSSNTLNKILEKKDTDIDEIPNSITITTDNDDNVIEITYHLNSYCQSNKKCNKKLELELIYEEFGSVEEIENPMS